MTKKTFYDFGVDARLCEALAEAGITEPFPIQELTLPVALDGHDVIGQARTGSGKTLGFGLPLLNRLDLERREVQALVVTPTRELCLQVTEDFERAARKMDVKIVSIYGGVPIEPQTDTLKAGVHVVVGTPGRLLDHVRRGNLKLSTCRTLVLDEADEMLDMGFLPDVEQLIDECDDDRHTMLFSATMPTAVVNLARRYMDRPTFIRAEVEEHTIPDRMEQHFFLVHKLDKPRILARILQTPERGLAVVFTRTKAMADRLVDDLRSYEIDAVAIHGDLRQATRESNLGKFKSESSRHDVLVATEVAARGLDIDELSHVINYDPPEDEKMYLHRIGRTARAGGKGVAVTFATFAEIDRVNAIRKALDLVKEPIEETFSTSDELTRRFDLPPETPWNHLASSAGSSSRSSSQPTRSKPSSSRPSRSRSGSSTTRDSRSGTSQRAAGQERSRTPAPSVGSAGDGPATHPKQATDGSTATRARTRTRSSSSGGSSSGGSSETSSSGSSSARTRARASRPKGTAPSSNGATTSDASSDRGASRSSSRPAGGGRGGSGRSSSGGRGSGGGRDAGAGRDRPSRGHDVASVEPGSDPTRPGDDARGDGEPGIARRVKVEHLP
ncbi:MAG TPA: DEAD/DEAH box helicase [Nitriliruptorales bacterium]